MPTFFVDAVDLTAPPRKRWTRAECDALQAAGAFDQQHLELIEGDLIDKMGKLGPHVIALALMRAWLARVFGNRLVLQNASIDVAPQDNPTNEPEPDVIVLNRDFWQFQLSKPRPEDLALVVEVADSTLHLDLHVKAALYARAGIVEYWVLDVRRRRLIAHRQPRNGSHALVLAYGEDESVSPLAAPQAPFRVAQAFAP